MSTPMLRIQSGMAYQTRPKGRPEENDNSATDAVRHDRIAATSAPNPLGRFSEGRVSTAIDMTHGTTEAFAYTARAVEFHGDAFLCRP